MDWTAQFAGLSGLSAEVKATLLAESRIAAVPKGAVIFGPGKAPENLLLLLEGAVRVQQTSESGREVLLYRVAAGESCVLTTACLLAYEDYAAEGMVSVPAAPRRPRAQRGGADHLARLPRPRRERGGVPAGRPMATVRRAFFAATSSATCRRARSARSATWSLYNEDLPRKLRWVVLPLPAELQEQVRP
jgi:hypothetical protein